MPNVVEGLRHVANQAWVMKPFPDPRFPPSVYYRFLYKLTEWWQPKLSVELGVCGGGGSLYLSRGYPDGKVVGVDVSVEYPDNLAYVQATCPNFTFLREDSIKAAEIVIGEVDILFIDTVHTYEQTMAEFNAWLPHLNGSSIVVLDDLYRDNMEQAWIELPGQHFRMDDLHIGGSPTDGGFGVICL